MPKAIKTKEITKEKKGKKSSVRNPKDSHLFTDDNPKTTLHGTGFKDAATANKTISLVSRRSLTYQFQTINTMLYRAKHHPHKTSGMAEAVTILQEWVDSYKTRKAALREFPLLSQGIIEKYLSQAESFNESHEDDKDESATIDTSFAQMYTSLPAKKRLANTLLDDTKPDGKDWEVRRYEALDALVPRDEAAQTSHDALWQAVGEPSEWHLRLIMWGYSPVKKLK